MARRNLGKDDVDRVMKLQKRYMQTAMDAALVGSAPRSSVNEMKRMMSGGQVTQPDRHHRRHGKAMDVLELEKHLERQLKGDQVESVFGY